MKASQFIQVAMIDQMQQIADLGLWWHLSKMIGMGINSLSVLFVVLINNNENNDSYDYFMPGYNKELLNILTGSTIYIHGSFGGAQPEIVFSHRRKKHCTHGARCERMPGKPFFIHVPTLLHDYIDCCKYVIQKIEKGEIPDNQMTYSE